mgnify:CR=1 FL=1
MKCPNCGNEALFVNGKYVCVDCGIEITPEQQASQAMNSDFTLDPGQSVSSQSEVADRDTGVVVSDPSLPEVPPTPPSDSEVGSSSITSIDDDSNNSQREFSPDREVVEKPVEEFYKNELESAGQATEAIGSGDGVYDFGSPSEGVSAEPVTGVGRVEAGSFSAPTSETPPLSDISSNETVIDSAQIQDDSAEEENLNKNDGYFQPSAFDIKDTNQEPMENIGPSQTFESPPITAGVGGQEPTIENLQETAALKNGTLPEKTDDNNFVESVLPESAPGALPMESTSNSDLDTMLSSVASGQSVDAVNPPTVYPQTEAINQDFNNNLNTKNIKEEPSIPSVESVFGGGDEDTPTPQDFGLPAPRPEARSNKKIIILSAVGLVGLLIIGALLFVFLGGKKDPYPVTLSPEQITTISANVSQAMDEKQDLTVSYNLEANLSDLSAKEGFEENTALLEYFKEEYRNSGLWLLDKEDNVYLSSQINEKINKQTYISQGSTTYFYDNQKLKWNKESGYKISTVPSFIDPQSKGGLIYASSIESAQLLGVESINGLNTRVFGIQPQKDFLKNLDFLGKVFSDAGYISTDASGVNLKVWIGDDDKIYRVSLEGKVSVDGDQFSGEIYLNTLAEYSYQSVLIKNPLETAEGDPPGKISSDKIIEGKEEGEPSSVINEPIVEEITSEEVIGIEKKEKEIINAKG